MTVILTISVFHSGTTSSHQAFTPKQTINSICWDRFWCLSMPLIINCKYATASLVSLQITWKEYKTETQTWAQINKTITCATMFTVIHVKSNIQKWNNWRTKGAAQFYTLHSTIHNGTLLLDVLTMSEPCLASITSPLTGYNMHWLHSNHWSHCSHSI